MKRSTTFLRLCAALIGTVALYFSAAALTIGCSRVTSGQDDAPPFRPPVINDQVRVAANAQQQFGWSLYRELASGEDNLFCSPISISTAMSMVALGASGETESQMRTTLNIPDEDDPHHAAMTELIQLLNVRDKSLQLRMANRLWAQADLEFRDDFLARMRLQYFAPVGKVNFRQNAEAARQMINDWVSQQTEQRIRELFAAGAIDQDTRLVVANAIYFKADWKTPFRKEATKPADFFRLDGTTIQTDTMHRSGDMLYANDEHVRVVSLPYTGQGLSFVVLLPKQRDGLAALEERLNSEYLHTLLSSLRSREVRLALPKFTMETKYVLNDTLRSMGIERAFTPQAQFDRMTTHEELMIGTVVHKAFIEVNEQGTEAAAATGVEMKVASAVAPPEPEIFKAEHPFVFLIKHDASGAILFSGRLTQPTPK